MVLSEEQLNEVLRKCWVDWSGLSARDGETDYEMRLVLRGSPAHTLRAHLDTQAANRKKKAEEDAKPKPKSFTVAKHHTSEYGV